MKAHVCIFPDDLIIMVDSEHLADANCYIRCNQQVDPIEHMRTDKLFYDLYLDFDSVEEANKYFDSHYIRN